MCIRDMSDSMRRNVERMGEHFLLTSREMDVLTLYALGHTCLLYTSRCV